MDPLTRGMVAANGQAATVQQLLADMPFAPGKSAAPFLDFIYDDGQVSDGPTPDEPVGHAIAARAGGVDHLRKARERDKLSEIESVVTEWTGLSARFGADETAGSGGIEESDASTDPMDVDGEEDRAGSDSSTAATATIPPASAPNDPAATMPQAQQAGDTGVMKAGANSLGAPVANVPNDSTGTPSLAQGQALEEADAGAALITGTATSAILPRVENSTPGTRRAGGPLPRLDAKSGTDAALGAALTQANLATTYVAGAAPPTLSQWVLRLVDGANDQNAAAINVEDSGEIVMQGMILPAPSMSVGFESSRMVSRSAEAHSAAITRQIAEAAVTAGEDAVELALAPEELGKLRMRVARGEHHAVVTVWFDSPDVLAAARRNAGQLLQDLRDSGLENATLDLRDGADRRDGGSHKPTHDSFDSVPDGRSVADPAGPDEGRPAIGAPSGPLTVGQLDIRV